MTQIIERPTFHGDDEPHRPLLTTVPDAPHAYHGASDQPGTTRRDGNR